MKIGNIIRDRRKQQGLTQKELGDRIHKSAQVISNWERGYTESIVPEDLQLLAQHLGVSYNYLLGAVHGDGSPQQRTIIEDLFPDNPEIVKCLHNISEDGFISDGDSKYKLDESARNMLRAMIIAALKEAKEKGIDHAKIHLP